ncbi:MAG: type II toxin-antitoxin system VapC family toxin [Pseudomonadota bacterium]
MKPSVYIESSVISYLTARPSNDVIKSARQAITLDWWELRRSHFEIFVSSLVEKEIQRGDEKAASKRKAIIDKLDYLDISETAKKVSEQILYCKLLPENSAEDALHIGIAAAEGINFLLTWNFKHINNAETKNLIVELIHDMGYTAPVLCSPEELGGNSD